VNGCFLAAGVGVTSLAGWWRGVRSLPGALGVSYLCGVAAFGVTAQLLYVLGASLARWQVLLVCAVLAVGSLRGLARRGKPVVAAPPTAWGWLFWPVAGMLALLAVDLWYQPLWAYDAWTFWTPKAHALYALNGLSPGWFAQADLLNRDYPLLLPAVEAAGFRFTGYETRLLDLQSWLLLVGFLRAMYEIVRPRASPLLLWATLVLLVVAPSVADQLASAEADIPVAAFFGVAGLCAWLWLVEGSRPALVLAVVLSAGAAATKVEGLIFTIALFASLAVVVGLERPRRAVTPAAAGAVALLAGLLPWRIWIAHHGIHDQASFGRVADLSFLADHLARAPIAAGYMVVKAVDPRAWLLVLPFAVVLLWAGRGRPRRELGFVLLTVLLGFAGLLLAYWTTPFPFHYHLAVSARRIITGLVFFLAAVAPLVAAPSVPVGE
jgi:hypothetical protein